MAAKVKVGISRLSHALAFGAEASAIAYIQIKLEDGRKCWGAAVDTSIELASIKAILGAVNRSRG